MVENDRVRREITELVESGWRIESETPERVTLVKRNFGSAKNHLIIAVLTIWWLLGVPNLLYAAYKYFDDSDRTIVWKRNQEAGTLAESETETG
jgi:hypothetical protein